MPPILATFLTIGFIIWLFRRDLREKPNVTRALWIPLLWMLIISSRFVSQWLDIFGIHVGGVSIEDGSPLDRLVFLGLILAGISVLRQRHVTLTKCVRHNRWLTIFIVYCFIAIVWSDFPFVAFKRWIKILGHPIMVLVLFSEPDPQEAITRLLKRCAYVLLPMSVLFIKYFPEYGRGFDSWSGLPMNMGVTLNKNSLGLLCMIVGFFYVWHLLKLFKAVKSKTSRNELRLTLLFLAMTGWLLWMANSQTSLVSLLTGVFVLVFLGWRWVNKRTVGAYFISGIVVLGVAEMAFGLSATVLKLLGRNPTLTDRTEIWHDVLNVPINPILGAGFESFWMGDRLTSLWEKWPHQPNQAHNGYIETYLNLGLLGLFILLALLVATYCRASRELLWNFPFGRFRMGFLVAVIVYNWTEASFKALHPVWFVFYIIALDYPRPKALATDEAFEPIDWESEENRVSRHPAQAGSFA